MPLLTCDRVEVRYLRRTPTGPITATFRPGLWRLAGASSRRRTALMLCLSGQRIPTVGDVAVDGRSLIGMPAVERNQLIGFLPVKYPRPWTMPVSAAWQLHAAARGNPGWGGDAYREQLGLPPNLMMYEADPAERRGAEILSAIAGDPPILLFDEPFAELDEARARAVASWLDARRKTHVILFTGRQPWLVPDDTLRIVKGEAVVWPAVTAV
jgi:ABC-type multidrug transport system ATPase subunit